MKRMIDDSVLTDIADAIREKNGTDTKYEDVEMAQAVRDIQGGEEVFFCTDGAMYIEHMIFPDTVTSIKEKAYKGATNIKSVILSKSIKVINKHAFQDCNNLTYINIPDNLATIDVHAFSNVKNMSSEWAIKATMRVESIPNGFNGGKLIFEEGVTSLPGIIAYNYSGCTFSNNAYVYLPSTISEVSSAFTMGYEHSALKSPDGTCTLEVGEGFNVSINASKFIQTTEKWIKVFNALYDRTGLETYTLTIGATNLAKLPEEDIAIATNKNWTVA